MGDFKSDIEIAQATEMWPIEKVAEKIGISADELDFYGKYKAKVDYNELGANREDKAKLVLVTAINPTPAGEGKTTTVVGLGDALNKIGKKNDFSIERTIFRTGIRS